jgi:hypothetical protein
MLFMDSHSAQNQKKHTNMLCGQDADMLQVVYNKTGLQWGIETVSKSNYMLSNGMTTLNEFITDYRQMIRLRTISLHIHECR